ncbi:MAG: PEGA domain-containing protein, partial [Vicinamibacterales bacterium]|nr:PEGA domain-containing protein [Vicinamibacterales bacterium]
PPPPPGGGAVVPRPPAAEAKPVSPRATPVRTGTVRVRTTPSQADVFVDGERRGVTPRNVASVPFGTHTIRVTRPGYQPQERSVTIGEGTADVRVSFTLKRAGRTAPSSPAPPAATPLPAPQAGAGTTPSAAVTTGSIAVETRPPGARVRIDNRDVGVTPIVVGDVKAGTHVVRLELAGYRPWVTTVTVKAGARARIAASLEAVSERSTTR